MISIPVEFAYWLMIAMALVPVLLLVFSWRRFFVRRDQTSTGSMVTLAVASISHTWLALGMVFPSLLGSDHSVVRFTIIDVNYTVIVASLGASLVLKSPFKAAIILASWITAALWAIAGALNSSA